MTREFYVYRHLRLDTGLPFYIGKGVGRRAWISKGRNKYWRHIVDSAGYEIEFIAEGLTEEQALKKEIEFIALYKRSGFCEANIALGGGGTAGLPGFWKGKSLSEETREKIASKLRGLSSWNKGKSLSNKHKKSLSNAHKGLPSPRRRKVINKISGVIYESITQAARETGIWRQSLNQQLSGTLKNETDLQYL